MGAIRVGPVQTAADWKLALDVRRAVFVEEQGVPEVHEVGQTDLKALHVLATRDGTPVATGRLVVEADGPLPEPPTHEAIHADHVPRAELARKVPRVPAQAGTLRGRIGRMAVVADARREGVGRMVLAALEANAWRMGLSRVVLAAQESAIPFYAAHGYAPIGERFMEAGISHQWMEKRRQG